MSNYNYNEGKSQSQRKALQIFKSWFDCEGICQFSYRCNRSTNYFVKYPVFMSAEGESSLETNVDEMIGGRLGKVSRKALHDVMVDYHIDIVCVHKGCPIYGFMIVDGYVDPEILGRMHATRHC